MSQRKPLEKVEVVPDIIPPRQKQRMNGQYLGRAVQHGVEIVVE